jgi:hypothetical protein
MDFTRSCRTKIRCPSIGLLSPPPETGSVKIPELRRGLRSTTYFAAAIVTPTLLGLRLPISHAKYKKTSR